MGVYDVLAKPFDVNGCERVRQATRRGQPRERVLARRGCATCRDG